MNPGCWRIPATSPPGGAGWLTSFDRRQWRGCRPARVEYRLDRRGEAVVLVFHGGHVRAELAVGEGAFAAADCTLLVPSRPGYGRTPLSTGRSVEGFTDVVRALCAHMGITRIAVVGISGGGPSAATMAARHADSSSG